MKLRHDRLMDKARRRTMIKRNAGVSEV